MAERRRMKSWPWRSFKRCVSCSSINASTSSSCSPTPSAQEHTLVHSHVPLIKNRSLLPRDRLEQLVRNLVAWPKALKGTEENGMTALHFAVLEGDEMCTKALIVFGADINALNHFDQTPLDIAMENQRAHPIVPLLISVGGEKGDVIKSRRVVFPTFSYPSPEEQVQMALMQEAAVSSPVVMTTITRPSITASSPCSRVSILTDDSGRGCTGMDSVSSDGFSDLDSLSSLNERCGHILCLDGGGVRGLIQIEVLSEIERITGNKITEIFDWIIGTSTGGIIALLLVYKQKSVPRLRQIYFKLKDQVFTNAKMGGNSEELERLLKEEFGTEIKMSDIKHPKVLITAVHKASTQPKLHFFNNCFGDEFSTQPVWKVARYTSAAPMYFTECDNYVDGGVLANNPCDEGLIKIQSHYRHLGVRIPISCVVSIGCGVYPARDLGRVDVHQFFSFGLHWFNRTDTLTARSSNLLRLLSNALLESEAVAKRCSAHCAELGVPFHRVSPQLSEEVMSRETDCHKIVDMLFQSKTWVHTYRHMETLGPLLRRPLPLQGICSSVLASLCFMPASI